MAIPKNDPELVPYVTNWNTQFDDSPIPFGVSPQQAAALAAISGPYVASVATINAQRALGTRAKSQTEARNTARDAMLVVLRSLYAAVQFNPDVSDQNKTLLGVTIRSDSRQPTPPISQRPTMANATSVGRTVSVSLYDPSTKSKRAKAPNAVSALVYAFVGEQYPSDPTLWQLCGVATRSTFETTFADGVAPGSTVWFCAAWVDRKGNTGPASLPISTNLAGGGVGAATRKMKLAA